MSDKYLGEYQAQTALGLSPRGWSRFIEATGIRLYGLPGAGRVVDRDELQTAVEKHARPMRADEAGVRR